MNDDSKKDTPAVNTETPAPDQPNQGTQETHQPADEEIGDYADPDSVQVDGGDNSFIADEDREAGAAKKSDAG